MTSDPFQQGWYRILDDHAVIGGPVEADTVDALVEFIKVTNKDWPGRMRTLQFSQQRYGPWTEFAVPPGA